jgi:hypothetical protein
MFEKIIPFSCWIYGNVISAELYDLIWEKTRFGLTCLSIDVYI